MARPQKNNADYFPHDNDMRDDERIKAVRRKFSHIGYSIWNMLVERLCRAEYFKVDYSEDSLDIMAGDFDIEPERLKEIIEYFIKLKLITLQDGRIFSQTLITRLEVLIRKRKRDVERLSPAKITNGGIIADDNAQSKVKNSKVNTKEKGEKENAPRFLEKEGLENSLSEITFNQEIIAGAMLTCKGLFLQEAKFYVWEQKDEDSLKTLLCKLMGAFRGVQTSEDLTGKFFRMIEKLPEFWRSKKFTLVNLNQNFNEIVGEIRSKQKVAAIIPAIAQRQPYKEPQITDEKKQEIRQNFTATVCEQYRKFCEGEKFGLLSLSPVYDLFSRENILKLPDEQWQTYQEKAIAQRKHELANPQNKAERNAFKALLDNYDPGSTDTEKSRIESIAKELAVKDFLTHCKRENIDLQKLLTH